MANLKLEIIVDDKGGVKVLRQFGDEAKKAGTDSARSFDMASLSAGKLATGVKALISAYAVKEIAAFGKEVFEAGRSMDATRKAYTEIAGSTAAMTKEFGFLHKAADDTGQNFYSLTETYKGFLAASKGTNLEGEKTKNIYLAIAKASATLGLSNENTRGALYAVQQMMSKGIVSAEELRQQLGERLPGAYNLMAEAMGVSVARLQKMLEKGEVLSDVALPKLAAVLEGRYSGAAAESTRAVNKMAEAWTGLKVNLSDGGFADAAIKALTGTAKALNWLSDAASLRSVLETRGQAVGLAAKGQLDLDAFNRLSFMDRQKMVDDALAAQKQIAFVPSEARFKKPAGTPPKAGNIPSESDAKKALKAAEDEAAVYQDMYEGAKEVYTYTFKMEAEAAKAEDDRIKQTLAGIESAEKAEQEKSEMLGQMAMVDQKIAEGTAKDKADAYRTMYGDMKGDTEQYYSYQLTALNKERDNYEKLTGDKVIADKWYLNQKKKLDQDLALSSNKFFKGIEVGYERMLDDQMTWAKGGLAIFNTFAKSGQSTISNVLFDGIKGDLKSFEDYWDNFFDSLLRTFTDTVAEMATQKIADAAVKPLVNFVGGAAGAAGGAAWDWLSELDWFHAGSYMVGNQIADQRGKLSSDDIMAILQKGEMVIPKDVAEQIRAMIGGGSGGSFSAPDWLSILYSDISNKVGKTPLLKDEQGNLMGYDPYAHVKDAIADLFYYPGNITKEGVAQKISNSGFAYIGGNGAPYLLVNTGKEGRDYAFRANLSSIDALSNISAGVSTINIPASVLKQISMMMSGGSGGNADPFSGISAGASGVPGGAGIGSRMLSAYAGTAIQGLMSGQISAYGLLTPAFRAVMEATQESYGTETGSGRYSTAGTILGGLVAALTQNPVFGMLTAMGISGYGNYSYTKEKADILAMNPDIANALAGGYGGGYGGESSMGGSGIPGGYGWRYGGIARGPESGYTARLHGTELVVSQKKDVPVKISDSGGGSDLPPVQINLNLDGKTLAKVLYKQTRAGVKTIHDRGLTNV